MVLRRDDGFGPAPGRPPDAPSPSPKVMERAAAAPFCTTLIAVCVAIFVAQLLGVDFFEAKRWWLFGPAVQRGEWWRVLTSVLVHGGSSNFFFNFLHIFFNMMVVMNLGFDVERLLGTPRMVAISLVSALGAAAMVLAFAFENATLGASGVILGWAGALLPVVNRRGRQNLGWLLAQVAVVSMLSFVSWQGHLGGFLAGLACGGLLRLGGDRFKKLWPALAVALALANAWLARAGGLLPPRGG